MTVKKKIITALSVFVVFIALIIYFIILPTINDIKKISDAVYAERVELEIKYLRGQLLKKTIEDFEKIRPKKEKLSSVFIREGNELEFITALEKIASFYNLNQDLKLQSARDDKDKKNYYYAMPLTVNIQGEFTKTLEYLKSLEQLNYYFNISSLDVTASEQKNLVSTNLKGEIYALSKQGEE